MSDEFLTGTFDRFFLFLSFSFEKEKKKESSLVAVLIVVLYEEAQHMVLFSGRSRSP
jgi:hypothetical protein